MDDTRYEPVSYFIGHLDGVTHIDSKMDGRYLISNSKDQSIKLWDMRSCARSSQEKLAIRTRQSSRNRLAWDYRWDEVPYECECIGVWLGYEHSGLLYSFSGFRLRSLHVLRIGAQRQQHHDVSRPSRPEKPAAGEILAG